MKDAYMIGGNRITDALINVEYFKKTKLTY